MGKVIQFKPREKAIEKTDGSQSLKDVTAGELLYLFFKASDKLKQEDPKKYFGIDQPEPPEQPFLFACMKCGVTVVDGGEKLTDTRSVYIRKMNALLYKKAKVRAAQMGITLQEWLQDAMREKLIRDPEPKEEEE